MQGVRNVVDGKKQDQQDRREDIITGWESGRIHPYWTNATNQSKQIYVYRFCPEAIHIIKKKKKTAAERFPIH